MSENNEESEIVPKGKEWEVVTLTESIYAAGPAPKGDILHKNQATNLTGAVSPETANTMFMSGHFGYSSNMHEKSLPEPKIEEIGKPELEHEESFSIKGTLSDEYAGFKKYDDDEKGNSMSFYSAGKFGSYNDEDVSGVHEPLESADPAANPGVSKFEEDKFSELPSIPCEARWRRCVDSLCGCAKSVNPYWSIAAAAAVVGIVIIGHRYQRDNKPQFFQIKSLLAVDKERSSGWILGPMATLKDTTLSGRHILYT